MKKKLFVLFWILFLIKGLFFSVFADELDEIQKQIDDLKKQLELSIKATKPLEAQLSLLSKKVEGIEGQIDSVEKNLKEKELILREKERDLLKEEELLRKRVFELYKKVRKRDFFQLIFSSEDFSDFVKSFFYQNRLVESNKRDIVRIFFLIKKTEEQRQNLESDKKRLEELRQQLNEQKEFLAGEVAKAKKFQSELKKKIAELTQKQKEILAARAGSFTTSVGEVPLADDPNASPNFNPGFSPAFAAFSFGAYTHRKGMSQYGAKGRAESGQNYKEILKAYFGKEPVSVDTGGSIKVKDYGELDFEGYYLLGIAEMPSSFPFEALKAQAVAARSFAYRYKTQGLEICTTQACQVFLKSKADNPPEQWKKAVEETKGEIIPDVVAFYSSTTGGYLLTSGWDTKCGNQSCWPDQAFEKIAGSPWFYKAWYRQTYSNSSNSCGRSHPWLTREEFLDILNAWIVRTKGSESDVARILPVTIKDCPISSVSVGDEPFSISEMKKKADELGGAFLSISDVSVSFSQDGYTASVIVSTNKGKITIPGQEFKDVFNLRAPGYISIRNKLFNIEMK